MGFRNLLRAQNFCYEVSLKVTDFVTNYEFWEHWTDRWAPGVSALFQLDSTSAELVYGLLLQKGKGQKDLFLFLVIEFAQFCLLSRTALVPLTVIHWLLSIFQ